MQNPVTALKKLNILKFMMIPIGILNLIIMALVISILAYSFYIKKDTATDITSVTQIDEDWALEPFTTLTVRTGGCLSGEEPAFSVQWDGTNAGCDLSGTVQTQDEFNRKKKGGKCTSIPAVAPVAQDVFFGEVICGTRGGDPFSTATRVSDNGYCPAGYVPCSQNTSPDNTICFPASSTRYQCPITSMFFVDPSKVSSYTSNNFKTAGSIGGKYLVYSKSANGMPITTTHVGLLPCMNPGDVQTTRFSDFYKLEVQQPQNCSDSINRGKIADDRFTYLGLSTTELDVQYSSGVLATLQAMPDFEVYVPDYKSSKTATPYNFYARATIPWTLACEAKGKTREGAFSVLADASVSLEEIPAGYKNLNALIAAAFLVLFLCFVFGVLHICAACECGTFKGKLESYVTKEWRLVIDVYVACGVIVGLIQIFLGVMIPVYYNYTMTNYDFIQAKVDVLNYVNGCSDTKATFGLQSYTSIITAQIVKADLLYPIGASVIGLGCGTLLFTFIGIGLACKAGPPKVEHEEEVVRENEKGTELQQSDRKHLADTERSNKI